MTDTDSKTAEEAGNGNQNQNQNQTQSDTVEYLCSSEEEIVNCVEDARTNFNKTRPTSYEYRINQIQQLFKFLDECEDGLTRVLQGYYHGSATSHWVQRLYLVKQDCHLAMTKLKEWMQPIPKQQVFPFSVTWNAQVEYHPRGVCAVIAPWNFPILLALRPLIGAIIAGNAVIVKPSEITDGIARFLSANLLKYLDPAMVKVVCGGPKETNILLEQKLNMVLFTGSTAVGRIVLRKCSENLVPCVLELGGKNPVIIDDSSDLNTCMKRIADMRFNYNCGQICLAPEYVFLSRANVDRAIALLRQHLQSFYSSEQMQSMCAMYFSIVNDPHYQRVTALRDAYLKGDAEAQSKVVIGHEADMKEGYFGAPDAEQRYLPPMVLSEIDFVNDPIMKSEVFGPILSLVPMDGTSDEWRDTAIQLLRTRGEPLVCYLFSRDSKFIQHCNQRISCGRMVVNDTNGHPFLADVPFGGIGESGMGAYNAQYSFLAFSHERTFAQRAHGIEFMNDDVYPNKKVAEPYANKKLRMLLETTNYVSVQTERRKKVLKCALFLSVVGIAAFTLKRVYASDETWVDIGTRIGSGVKNVVASYQT